MPFQLGYRAKNTKAPIFGQGLKEIESDLGNQTNGQTNPEGPARLTRRLIMDLVCIVMFATEYSTIPKGFSTNKIRSYSMLSAPLSSLDLSLSPRKGNGAEPAGNPTTRVLPTGSLMT